MDKDKKKFLRQAARLALKSGCLRGKRGAVIVREGRAVSAFNTVFPDNKFCLDHGCLRDKLKLGLGKELEKCRSIHAEALAICLAAQKKVSLKGATAYITSRPCINCAKLLFTSGVKEVYFLDHYGDTTGQVFLEKMGVLCKRINLENDNPGKRLRDTTRQKE